MLTRLQTAIRGFYDCDCQHIATVPVRETEGDRVIWNGKVEVFDLIGHKLAKQCYGWEQETPEGGIRIVAILRKSPDLTAQWAVRTALRSEKLKY